MLLLQFALLSVWFVGLLAQSSLLSQLKSVELSGVVAGRVTNCIWNPASAPVAPISSGGAYVFYTQMNSGNKLRVIHLNANLETLHDWDLGITGVPLDIATIPGSTDFVVMARGLTGRAVEGEPLYFRQYSGAGSLRGSKNIFDGFENNNWPIPPVSCCQIFAGQNVWGMNAMSYAFFGRLVASSNRMMVLFTHMNPSDPDPASNHVGESIVSFPITGGAIDFDNPAQIVDWGVSHSIQTQAAFDGDKFGMMTVGDMDNGLLWRISDGVTKDPSWAQNILDAPGFAAGPWCTTGRIGGISPLPGGGFVSTVYRRPFTEVQVIWWNRSLQRTKKTVLLEAQLGVSLTNVVSLQSGLLPDGNILVTLVTDSTAESNVCGTVEINEGAGNQRHYMALLNSEGNVITPAVESSFFMTATDPTRKLSDGRLIWTSVKATGVLSVHAYPQTASCSGVPTIANAGAGDCSENSATGTTCVPACNSGFSGILSATCTATGWTTAGTCSSTSCSTLPSVLDAGAGTCSVPATAGTVCEPSCNSGFAGTISATCNSGTWSTTGTCTSTSCATLPSVLNAGAGTCSVPATSGTVCAPECNSGFAGTISATCTSGSWSTTGTCDSTSCTTLPSVLNGGAGTCSVPATAGTVCAPECNSGFDGTISATCTSGSWSITGTCTSTRCMTLPSVLNGGSGTCSAPSDSGTVCAPSCNPGFAGTISATCISGSWSTTGTCVPATCTTLPPVLNTVAGTCSVPADSGTVCAPSCNSGFTGTISATCNSGSWSTTGTCTPAQCTMPPSVSNAGVGTCSVPADSGTVCAPSCNSGFTGTISATCNSGSWSNTGTCTPIQCTTPPSTPNAEVGTCSVPADSGTVCAPSCNPGFTGTISATCNSGSWTTTGACTTDSCTALPFISNGGAGTCSVPATSGTVCAPSCNPDFSGTISATCTSGSWTTIGTCDPICSTLPSIPDAAAGNCEVPVIEGTTCVPICNSGFSGTLSARCSGRSWVMTGTCTSTSCATLPSIPNAGAGDCRPNSATGATCVPTCNSGFFGTLSATCNSGEWSVIGTCTSTSCAALPSIPDAETGDCISGSATGTTCSPVCRSGFSGTLSATCSLGTWSISGSCLASCTSVPTVTNGASGNCEAGSTVGSTCTPVCNSGYSGTLLGQCHSGGSWAVTGTCNGNPCSGIPTVQNGVAGDCRENSASGTTCTPVCNSGFSGTVSATCTTGSWSVSGACAAVVGLPCTTLPNMVNANTGDCATGTASGVTCTPVCNSGFSGTLSATCSSGTWVTTGNCISSACGSLPSIPNAGSGNCAPETPSGSTCVPSCNSGFGGILSASCSNSVWTVSGTCASTACASFPNIPNSAPGDCQVNSASGTTCTPVCNSGLTGTLSATCDSGAWTTTGACLSRCSGVPTIADGTSGNCIAESLEGVTCAMACNSGFSGNPSATCSVGAWSVSGVCASSSGNPCFGNPEVPNGMIGNCVAPTLSGGTCAPVCSSGFTGNILATCNSGVWSISGTCSQNICSGLPNIPNSNIGDCVSDSPNGAMCTLICNADFSGTLSATCTSGIWVVSGACASTSCTALPVIPHGTSGNCISGSQTGITCTPTCQSGFSGTLGATCSFGTWVIDGVCTQNPTPRPPPSGGARFFIRVSVTLGLPCDENLDKLVEELNGWLRSAYEGVNVILVVRSTSCQEKGSKRQTEADVVLEGTMEGSDASQMAPNAPVLIESFFFQSFVSSSALEVTVTPADEVNEDGLSGGAIAGIVIGSIVALLVLLLVVIYFSKKPQHVERV